MTNETKQMLEVYCVNTKSKILVPWGISLLDLIKFTGLAEPDKIIGACVNNKLQNLYYQLYSTKTIEYVDIEHVFGKKIYASSLMMLTYKAVKDIFPKSEMHILHSTSYGYYAEIKNVDEEMGKVVPKIKEQMQELIAKDLPFERRTIASEDAIELFEKVGLKDKADLIRNNRTLYTKIDVLDNTINSFVVDMVPSTKYLTVWDIKPFENGLIILLPDFYKNNKETSEPFNQKKMLDIFQEYKRWVKVLDAPYVFDLNKKIAKGEVNQLIQTAEALHEKKYAQIADAIYKKKDNVKFIFLAGPSSSGKTTSCRRLATQLSVLGIKALQISLDDYFLDREHTPRDKNGNYDFECLEALDLDFLALQMKELMEGKEIALPRFNFVTGEREESGTKIQLKEENVVIIEGIHALNPRLSKDIARKNKYFIFVSALTQVALDQHNLISTGDNRLIRRIVRDNSYRGSSAEKTLMMWQSVRRGEEKHIFPYQENADSIFNSSLLYEIGVLKHYCEPLLMEVPQNSPAYAKARHLIDYLRNFSVISPDFIPPTSIMREFLGGSSFTY